MEAIDDGCELEIDWGSVMPYVQCGHPAIHELARLLMLDVTDWFPVAWACRAGDPNIPNLEHPLDRLNRDPRSSYECQSNAPRLRVSGEFHEQLRRKASELYNFIHQCAEVLPSEKTRDQRSGPRLVVDNTLRVAAERIEEAAPTE
jgi:hypothetical protein